MSGDRHPVHLRMDGPIARLVLDRREHRNALSVAVLDALESAIDAIARSSQLRAMVLTGEGPSFCAGADLAERRTERPREERRHVAERWQELFERLERLPQVTVAAVQGAAIGGGLLLALACDVRLAASDLMVRLPEVTLGVPVSGAGMPRLVREIGIARARDLILSGRTLDATQACEWGLVTRVVEPGELCDATEQLLAEMLLGPPDGLRVATRALRSLGRGASGIELGWADSELVSYRNA